MATSPKSKRGRRLQPPRNFSTVPLKTVSLLGRGFCRLFRRVYDPLSPSPAASRFADPPQYGYRVLYLARAFHACFAETLVRDRFDLSPDNRTIGLSELHAYDYVDVEFVQPLRVADLRSPAITAAGIPTDVAKAANHKLGRRWSADIYNYRKDIDGLLYSSRFAGDDCLAVYDRALAKLRVIHRARLLPYMRPQVSTALDLFNLDVEP